MKTVQCLRCNTTTTINNIQPGDVITCQSCGCIIAHIPDHSDYHPDSPCPYCGSELTDDDITVFCPECQMEYHLDCWNEGEGCATYGCKMTGVLRPVPTKITLDDLQSDSNIFPQNSIGTGIPMPTGRNIISGSRIPVHKAEGSYYCKNCNRMVARNFCPYCCSATQKINSHIVVALLVTVICLFTLFGIGSVCFKYMLDNIVYFQFSLLLFGVLSIIISIVSKVCMSFNEYNISKKLGNISLVLSSIILLLVFFVILIVLLQCN